MARRLRVLVLSHLYPRALDPVLGSFVEDQVTALAAEDVESLVISGAPRGLGEMSFLRTTTARRVFARLMPRRLRGANGIEPARPGDQASAEGATTIQVRRPAYILPREPALRDLRSLSYAEACRRELRALGRRDFDLVHAHTALLDGYAGALIAEKLHVPLVITEHMGPFSVLTETALRRRFTRRAYGSAARIIAVSSRTAEEIRAFLGGDPPITVIPNGYRSDLFVPETLTIPPGARKPRYILFAGFFEEQKGLDILMSAFELLKTPEAELHLVGGGNLAPMLEAWARRSPKKERIHVHGRVDRTTVAFYMQHRCDVFVLPSRYESFGIVAIEAMATGKPVVATRCGGPELTVAPEVGVLVPPLDPPALARALDEVLANLDRYPADRLVAYARSRFSYTSVAAAVRRAYDEVLGERVPTPAAR